MKFLAAVSLLACLLIPSISFAKAKKETTRTLASVVEGDTVIYDEKTKTISIDSEPTGSGGAAYKIYDALSDKGYKEKVVESPEYNEIKRTIKGKNITCMQATGMKGGYKLAACDIKIQ